MLLYLYVVNGKSEWMNEWMSEWTNERTNKRKNERTNECFFFFMAVWTPIRYVTLQFRDRVGASSLRYKTRAEITVLVREQKLYPVWTDGRMNEGTNEGKNAFRVALWTPIRYVTLHFRARQGAASLRYRSRAEITVLMWEQKPYPVWMDGRERTDERTEERMLFVWQCEHLSDMWLFTLGLGTAQLRSVTEIAPKSPFLCENRRPIRYGFHAGAKAIWHIKSEYGFSQSIPRNRNGHYRTQTGLTTTKQQLTNFIPQWNLVITLPIPSILYHATAILTVLIILAASE